MKDKARKVSHFFAVKCQLVWRWGRFGKALFENFWAAAGNFNSGTFARIEKIKHHRPRDSPTFVKIECHIVFLNIFHGKQEEQEANRVGLPLLDLKIRILQLVSVFLRSAAVLYLCKGEFLFKKQFVPPSLLPP